MGKTAKQIRKLEDLTPDPSNVNRGSERGNYMLDWSLSNLGAWRSIAASSDGIVAGGNKTLEQAAERGMKILPVHTTGNELVVVIRDDIESDDPRFRQYAIADNRISEINYAADVEMLLTHQAGGVDLSPMYRDDEIEALRASILDDTEPGDPSDAEPQIDRAAELNKKWQVKTGDMWMIGSHRLLCGDSTKADDVARVMGGEKADCVITDPPYGQNQEGVHNDEPEIHQSLMAGAVQMLPIDDGIVIAFQSPRLFLNWLHPMVASGFVFERMLWMYKAAQCTFPWRGWILTSESILVFSKGRAQWQEVHPYAHDCYYLSEVSGELPDEIGWHGSVKPLKVVVDLMQRVCPESGSVYEPFAGSGTTLVAAQNLNRRCYAIEISPDYCAVILERMSQAFPDLEIKRG